jgi:hypothetical protein
MHSAGGIEWAGGGYPNIMVDVRHVGGLEPLALRFGPVFIPSPEEAEIEYIRVSEESGVYATRAFTIGRLLAHLPPMQEHIFRATYGMFPYAEELNNTQLAAHLNERSGNVRRGLRKALGTLSNVRPRTAAGLPLPTLEEIARELCVNGDTYDEDAIAFLCATKGLPPYSAPISVARLSWYYSLSERRISEPSQHLLRQVAAAVLSKL